MHRHLPWRVLSEMKDAIESKENNFIIILHKKQSCKNSPKCIDTFLNWCFKKKDLKENFSLNWWPLFTQLIGKRTRTCEIYTSQQPEFDISCNSGCLCHMPNITDLKYIILNSLHLTHCHAWRTQTFKWYCRFILPINQNPPSTHQLFYAMNAR